MSEPSPDLGGAGACEQIFSRPDSVHQAFGFSFLIGYRRLFSLWLISIEDPVLQGEG